MGAGIFSRGVVSAQWLGDHGGLECGLTAGGVEWEDRPKARSKDISQGARSLGPPTG